MRTIKLGILLAVLLASVSVFAGDKDKRALAEEMTILAYPAEFYGIYAPLAMQFLNDGVMDHVTLPEKEKSDLRKDVKDVIMKASIKAMIEARAELYTENELITLIAFYKSEIGKQIIDAVHRAEFKAPEFSEEESAAVSDFAKKHDDIHKKHLQLLVLFGKKIASHADDVGYEVGLLTCKHLDAYEKKSNTH